MPLSSNYVVLTTTEKFIYTGILRQIVEADCYVLATYYVGDKRLIRSPNKPFEEVDEICRTFQNIDLHQTPEILRQKIVKEIADSQQAIKFILAQLPGVASSDRALRPANARAEWDSWRHLGVVEELTSARMKKLKELAVATRQGLEMFMKRPDFLITQEEVDAAAAAKRKELGELEGWAIRKVALRKDFPWIGKYTPDHGWYIDTSSDFPIEHSLTLDMINSVTPPG